MSDVDRALLTKSFQAASKASTGDGLYLNRASGAGLLLYMCAGPRAALDVARHMPPHPFWIEVTRYLEGLVEADTHTTMSPIALASGGERR